MHNGCVPEETRRQPTIKDVAAAAGVSISTVSHVYSRARPISEPTAARVTAAAEALGYIPNPSAASLRGGQVGIFGLVLRPRNAVHGSLSGTETFTRFSGAAAAATLATGRGLLHVPNVLAEKARRVAMDGCIVMGPYERDDVVAALKKRHVPVVCADVDPSNPDDPWAVHVDYRPAVEQLLSAAASGGAQRLALIAGSEANNWTMSTRGTIQEWCSAAGLSLTAHDLFEGVGSTGAEGLAFDLLGSSTPPDTIVVSSTRFAGGVLAAAKRLSIRIPEDLRVCALTDSALTRDAEPSITSLDLLLEDQAKACVDLLIRALSEGSPPLQPVIVTPQVRWRASLGSPGEGAP
ncbi:LacI family DNA-binding transcriptional regulator [Arthrobacter bambusae]|uniref:LacI family DNA-binding transcriptional regulator n=1 Tax=Arthrobacter bambusae TaxID=1338426 RepID=UPI002784EB7A|nr:DNA-binding LacI/PurR family transcriptional regulator [Arthrobacter bambusae]MDQ0097543.1 DNA-binding LacI/PurR family transcriptional regulator [Arthrobacter bambusae]